MNRNSIPHPRALVSALFLAAAAAAIIPSARAANFGESLVGWWLCDEGGGQQADDSSGLGNDGTLFGDVAFTPDARLGTALDFTGSDGQVAIPYDPRLEPETGTIEVWVKVATLQDSDILYSLTDCQLRRDPTCTGGSGGAVIGLRIQVDGSAYAFVMNDDPTIPGNPWTIARASPPAITVDTWHHLAMRWDGAYLAFFLDGILRDARPYDPIPGSGLSYQGGYPFRVGDGTFWGRPSDDFIGQLDDLRFYGRARLDNEIFTDYVTKGNKPAMPLGK